MPEFCTKHAADQHGGAGPPDQPRRIPRKIALGWVVLVRCLLVFIPLSLLVLWAGLSAGWVGEETGWFELVLLFALELIYLQRFGRHIAETRAA